MPEGEAPGARKPPGRRRAARRLRRWLTVLLPLAAGVALLASGSRALLVRHPVPLSPGEGAEALVLRVEPGSSASRIARQLEEAGLLRSRFWFRALLAVSGRSRELKAGTYRFSGSLSGADLLRLLATGPAETGRSVTVPEGLTLRETVALLVREGLGTEAGFDRALVEVLPLVRSFDATAEDVEGYLFPDTYRVEDGCGEEAMARLMIGRFLEQACRILGGLPGGLGRRSLREVVVLASLAEEETALEAERPLVAGVFLNRLRLGMPLQCDPTVIYARKRAGAHSGRPLTRDDLYFPSPYNTYRHPGLPPGPICNPGASSLRAAAAPAATDALYFVADGRGGHSFTPTLREHVEAVGRYRAVRRGTGGR